MTYPHPDSRGQLRRAVVSSFLGSMIEYYDFMLYATASALVFSRVFFADLDPLAGTVASLGTFATGYVARPLGGLVFGHLGDRLGRKRMLVLSMTMMGLGSTLIGLLPTSQQIGTWAPVLLVVLRVVQGFAVGGEWGGAVLMCAEHASSRRGMWASFTNAGAPSGMVLSTLLLTLSAAATGPEAFLAWGWRIPFLLSAVLLVVGLVTRARVAESPVFAEAATSGATPGLPLLDVLRDRSRTLLLAIGTGLGAFVVQGTLTVFVVAYAVQAGFARQTVLNASAAASVVAIVGIVGFSALSDRFGRRPVVLAGAAVSTVWAFAIFPLIDSGSAVLLTVAVVVGLGVGQACMSGPLAALFAELFPTRTRYTGASLSYQVAGVGGGVAPAVFASVLAGGGSTVTISAIVAAGCLVTILCVLALRETSAQELDDRRPTTAQPVEA